MHVPQIQPKRTNREGSLPHASGFDAPEAFLASSLPLASSPRRGNQDRVQMKPAARPAKVVFYFNGPWGKGVIEAEAASRYQDYSLSFETSDTPAVQGSLTLRTDG
jgi:hypothetical protein